MRLAPLGEGTRAKALFFLIFIPLDIIRLGATMARALARYRGWRRSSVSWQRDDDNRVQS